MNSDQNNFMSNNQINLLEENAKLRQNIVELETTLQELVRQDSLIEKWTVMKNFVLVSTEVERLSLAYVALEKQYQQLINNQKNDVSDSEIKLKTLIAQLEELNQIMILQQKRIEELNNNNYLLNQLVDETNQKMVVVADINKKIASDEQNIMQEKQRLQKQLFDSNQELNNVMQTLKECEEMFKGTLEKQENIIHNLERQNEFLNNEIVKKDRTIDQLMKKNKELISDVERIDKKYIEQSIQMKKVSKMFESLEQEYKNYQTQQQANQSEFYTLTKRLEHKNQILVDVENKQDKLTVIVKSLESQLEEKEIKLNQYKQQLNEQSMEIEALRNGTKQSKSTSEKEIFELNTQVKRLQDMLTEIRQEREKEWDEKQKLQQLIKPKDQEIEKQIQQIAELQKEQQVLQKVITDLHQTLNVQKEMFQKAKLESASLKDSLLNIQESNLTNDLMKMEDYNLSLKNECQQLRSEAQYYKHQNYQLLQQVDDLKQTKTYLSNLLMDKQRYY